MINGNNLCVFDPCKDNPKILPNEHGFYLIALKTKVNFCEVINKSNCPKITLPIVKNHNVIYVGISSTQGIRNRDYNNHFNGSARSSTLRKSIGSLMLEISDRHYYNDGKYRFNTEKEAELSEWMKHNLLLFYFTFDGSLGQFETGQINTLSPPLNIRGNNSDVNKEFRLFLIDLRR